MKILKKFSREFFWPCLFAAIISSFYIFANPGKISGDAIEYEALARSIQQGAFSLNGVSSMKREPGYPFFRAAVETVSSNPQVILWLQALMFILVVVLIGDTARRIDPKIKNWGAWAAALSYGLAVYPAQHNFEILAAILLALLGWLFVLAIDHQDNWIWPIFMGVISGFLLLTRFSFVLVPVILFAIYGFHSADHKNGRWRGWLKVFIGPCICIILTSAWMYRNFVLFNNFSMAGRSGAVLYARAYKAEQGWDVLGSSYLSVLLGRGILNDIFPHNTAIIAEQWAEWWWKDSDVHVFGSTEEEIDKNRMRAAKTIIFSSPQIFIKFILWSGIDELRFLELTNPSPWANGLPIENTFGPLAKTKNGLPWHIFLGLTLAHLTQLGWFIVAVGSTCVGFKIYRMRFLPGILFLSVFIPHAVSDNIPRYGAPIQPWLLAGIALSILGLSRKWRETKEQGKS